MKKRIEIKKVVDNRKVIILTDVPENEGEEQKVIKEVYYDLPATAPLGSLDDIRKFMAKTLKSVEEICLVWDVAYISKEIGKLIIEGEVPATGLVFAEAYALCDRYNEASIAEALKDCADAEGEDPLMHAAKRLLYPTISVKESKEKDEPNRLKVTTRQRRIPIDRLHKMVPGGVGADKLWIYEAQAVNMVFTARAIASCVDGGDAEKVLTKINESDHMKEIAKKISLGETPTSNTKLLEHLRKCIGMMLGKEWEPKVLSHDVKHVKDLYVTEYKKDATGRTKQVLTHKRFYDLLLIVASKIVNGGEYTVFCKELQ